MNSSGPTSPRWGCCQRSAVMIVGGNIDGVTRVITTTIALETSKGNLPLALALGLVLLAIVGVVNAAITLAQRAQGAGLAGAR